MSCIRDLLRPTTTHNNGMHPTADTVLVIYFQTLGAAGDAGR
jgi:hypothetical protein